MLYVVRAVESRKSYVDEILKQIPEAVVYWDEFGDSRKSYLHTCKNIIGDTPCVLMEDDIILTSNFKQKIEAVIGQYPEILINFFSLSKKFVKPHFKTGREFGMTQCIYLPKGMGTKIVDSYESWPLKNETKSAFDWLVGYAWGYNKPYLVWCPSLVQHAKTKSVIDPRRSTKRQSITFEE